MTAQQYLEGLLAKQKLSDKQTNDLQNIFEEIVEVFNNEYNNYNLIYSYAGSYAKGTIIKERYDLDIVIYFPHTYPRSIRNIYNHVYQTLCNANYQVKHRKKEGVALQVVIQRKQGFIVDVVPGKAKDPTSKYAHLYKHGTNTRKPTSRIIHIGTVKDSHCRHIIKLMKLWKIRHGLKCWKSFHLELTVIDALKGYQNKKHYDKSLEKVLKFIQEAEIKDLRVVVDPANCNNPIKISKSSCYALKEAAEKSLNAKYWEDIIW